MANKKATGPAGRTGARRPVGPAGPGRDLRAAIPDAVAATVLSAVVYLVLQARVKAGTDAALAEMPFMARIGGIRAYSLSQAFGFAALMWSGSAEKVAYLTGELGYDAAFDYHTGDLSSALGAIAPEGFDVYFDNVGGDHLEAALNVIRPHGRVAVCGVSSAYGTPGDAAAPRNLIYVLTKRLRVEGFTVREHLAHYDGYVAEAVRWMHGGRLRSRVSVVEGLDRAVEAFRLMLKGGHRGKMLVRISDDPA